MGSRGRKLLPFETSFDFGKDRKKCIDLAKRVMKSKGRFVIFSLNTTGNGKAREVVEIASLNLDATVFFHKLVKPSQRTSLTQATSRKIGVDWEDLETEPTLVDRISMVDGLQRKRAVIAFGAKDMILDLVHSAKLAGTQFSPDFNHWICAEDWYAAFVGDYDSRKDDYAPRPLPSPGNNSIEDCLAVLGLIIAMSRNLDYMPVGFRLIKPGIYKIEIEEDQIEYGANPNDQTYGFVGMLSDVFRFLWTLVAWAAAIYVFITVLSFFIVV